METTETRIIEVNGVKLEVDLRHAKRVDTFRVGDPVKILKKKYNDYSSCVGTIVGFDNFASLPTIVIAYLEVDYYTARVEFAYINSETKDIEICPVNEHDIPYSKSSILDKMNNEINKKEEELRELRQKKEYFLKMFGKYFEHLG